MSVANYFSIQKTLIIHLVIQSIWILITATDSTIALMGYMTLCLVKTGLLMCLNDHKRVHSRLVISIQKFLDAGLYVLLIVDSRVRRLFGEHIISPMIWIILQAPDDQLQENLDTQSHLDFVPMITLGIAGIALVCFLVEMVAISIWNRITRVNRSMHRATMPVSYHKMKWGLYLLTMIFLCIFSIQWSIVNLDIFESSQQLTRQENDGDWCSETPVMKHRPNIVVVFYDSGRIDQFTNQTFPKMHELMSTYQTDCNLWPMHYSGGVQSDTGHVALLYGIIPTTSNLMKLQAAGDHPVSWPMGVLKENGYNLRAVSSTNLAYCWAIGRNCTMHRNIFDRYESAPDTLSLTERESWAAQRAGMLLANRTEMQEPYFLMVNFEATHYPYSYPPVYEIETPVASHSDVWKFLKTGSNDPETAKTIRNRYRNSARYTDGLIHRYIQPRLQLDRSLFFLTSDHGEFLTEYGKFGHTIGEFYEEETHVTALFCGQPMPTFDVEGVSSHADFLITVLDWSTEDTDAVLNPKKFSLPGRSLLSETNRNGMPFAFSIYPWSRTALLTDGTLKLWSDGEKVEKLTDMQDNKIPEQNNHDKNVIIDRLNQHWQELISMPLPCHKKPTSYLVQVVWMGDDGSKCLDRKTPGKGGVQIYNCWRDGWNQQWTWDSKKNTLSMNVTTNFDGVKIQGGRKEYLTAWEEKQRPVTHVFENEKTDLINRWDYSKDTMTLRWKGHDLCLQVNRKQDVDLERCNPDDISQNWRIMRI